MQVHTGKHKYGTKEDVELPTSQYQLGVDAQLQEIPIHSCHGINGYLDAKPANTTKA